MFARLSILKNWYAGELALRWRENCIFALTIGAFSTGADFCNAVADFFPRVVYVALAFLAVCLGFALYAAGPRQHDPYEPAHRLTDSHFKFLSLSIFCAVTLAGFWVAQGWFGKTSITASAAQEFGLLRGEIVVVQQELRSIRDILAQNRPVPSPNTAEELYANAVIYEREGKLDASWKAFERLYSDFQPKKIDAAALYVRMSAAVRGLNAARSSAADLASSTDDWRLDFAVAQTETRGDPTDAKAFIAVGERRPDCVICGAEGLAPERQVSFFGGQCKDPGAFDEELTRASLGIGKEVSATEEKKRAHETRIRLRAFAPKIEELRARLDRTPLGTQYFDVSNWNSVESTYRNNLSSALARLDTMIALCDKLIDVADLKLSEAEDLVKAENAKILADVQSKADINAGIAALNLMLDGYKSAPPVKVESRFDGSNIYTAIISAYFRTEAGLSKIEYSPNNGKRWFNLTYSDVGNQQLAKLGSIPKGQVLLLRFQTSSRGLIGPTTHLIDN